MSKYKYYFRPGYQSKELLIEVFDGAENETFISDFLNVIIELQPKMTDIHDLWMNDEILITIDSEIGEFTISKDIWGFAFIMTSSGERIKKIDFILNNSEMFEKVEVDYELYK